MNRTLMMSVTVLCLVLAGCSSAAEEPEAASTDVFDASTGAPVYKTTATVTPATDSQLSSVGDDAQLDDSPAKIFLTSPDKTNFLILVPMANAKTNFKVSDIMWVRNGIPQKKKSWNWSDLSEGDIFWAKYASKWDIKVRLGNPVSSWSDLLDAEIDDVLEHDLGKHNNVKMTEDWYFISEAEASKTMTLPAKCEECFN